MMFARERTGQTGDGRRPAIEAVRKSATQQTIGSSHWTLELRNLANDADIGSMLELLADASGGMNLFFEPVMIHAAAGRIGNAPLTMLMLYEQIGEVRTAKLALPVCLDRVGLPRVQVLRAFSHPYAPLSLPQIELDDADESLQRFAGLLNELDLALPLVLEDFPVDAPLAQLLIEKLRGQGVTVGIAGSRSRAVLSPDKQARDGEPSWLNPKRRRENARLLRKLYDLGVVEFEMAETFWDVLVRFEEFLLLETRSWKGRKGSSIHIIRKTAAFARQAIAALAKQGRATIYSLRLDGQVIASLIMLRSANRYYPWKTAFDEHYRAYAPGMQLMLATSRHLLATPGFGQADSLAREDSWMDRLWPEKMRLATLVVSHDPLRAGAAIAAISRLEAAKALARRILRRSAPQPVHSAKVADNAGQ